MYIPLTIIISVFFFTTTCLWHKYIFFLIKRRKENNKIKFGLLSNDFIYIKHIFDTEIHLQITVNDYRINMVKYKPIPFNRPLSYGIGIYDWTGKYFDNGFLSNKNKDIIYKLVDTLIETK